MRQEFADVLIALCGQSFEYVFEVGVRIVSVEFGGLDQTGEGGSALAGRQRAGKKPILATRGSGADLLLVVVIVDGQTRVAQVTRQRRPAMQVVVHRFGRGTT
jgi:hypothetical protein